MIEIWKSVVGFERRYKVSSQGRVRSLPAIRCGGKILKAQDDGDGRRFVVLYRYGRRFKKRVYNLVAEAFLGPANGRLVLHWDDDCSNDVLGNLRYGTHKMNGEDMVRNGNSTRGSKNKCCKLSESEVLEIRVLLLKKVPQTQIASQFGIHQMTVSDINRKHIWRWL